MFCPKAGPSLQTQAPRLQFCPKAGLPLQTQEPKFSFTHWRSIINVGLQIPLQKQTIMFQTNTLRTVTQSLATLNESNPRSGYFQYYIVHYIIIISVLPKGTSLQTQAPRLQFCPKAGLLLQTQEPRLQFY